jgi:hypothetical protein
LHSYIATYENGHGSNDERLLAILNAYQEMREEERKSLLEWMGAKTKVILAETKARRDKRMEANTNDDRNESTACQDAMEANPEKMEPNPEEKEATVEREDVPNEDVAVMPVKGLKKRRSGRKSTAG